MKEYISNPEFWDSLDSLVNNSKIVIDRPKGSSHPKYPDFIYPVEYGYLDKTRSSDGNGIDIWVGSGKKKEISAVMCIVDMVKRDSEIKLLFACQKSEIDAIFKIHNQGKLSGVLIKRA